MSTTLPDPAHASPTAAVPGEGRTSSIAAVPGEGRTSSWLRWLVILTSAVALGDVVFMALIPTAIPPLIGGIAITLLGIALLRRRPRAGIAVLGITSLVVGLVTAAFVSSHLAHPGSPVDFLHTVLSIGGRALAVLAALGAWRGWTETGGRRLGATALGLAAFAIAVSGAAVVATSSDVARSDDVLVAVTGSQFPETVTVERGQTLHLDNQDVFRHTFTVPDTDLDVDLPATTAARATVDLPPGSYDVICDIPGHEHMTAVLVVG